MGNRMERNNEPSQSLLSNRPTEVVDVALLVDQPNIKKICAVKNPVFIKKESIVLERSAEDRNIYYIQFKYDALIEFDLYINFLVKKDVEKDKEKDNPNREGIVRSYTPYYPPSSKARELSMTFTNLPRGQNVSFFDRHAIFDLRKFTECKDEIEESYDVAFEIVPNSRGHSMVFVNLCRITSEDGGSSIKIKTELQRLKVQGMWIDMYEVFNCALDAGECLICCTSERNTIFLPCKHSCTCSNCAHSLRMRNSPCPICKNTIDDLLIIEIEEGRNK